MSLEKIKKIQEINIAGKKVLLRVDFNVAIENGFIKEKFKIKACKKTIKYLLDNNAKIALISHFGRPNGKFNVEFSLKQLVKSVENILGVKIKFVFDCINEEIAIELNNLKKGEILLLENVRFYSEEESNNKEFAKKLAKPFDIFINDAFSVCHRDQASVTGVAKILPKAAGFWLQKEIANLEKIKNNPCSPAVAIIGGAKIETKLPLIKNFEKIYDYILVGGKIANEAIDQKLNFSKKVILPIDFAEKRLDIGPKTIKKFENIIFLAKTIVWNGPMGKFEEEKFAIGTESVLQAIIKSGAFSLVGGGESLEVLEKNNLLNKISFVSTGGGAMLEYLSGNVMPGIEVLN